MNRNQEAWTEMLAKHKPTQITVSRFQLWKTFMTPGPAWKWGYIVQFLDGRGLNESGRDGLADARSFAKKKSKELGNLPIVYTWE